MVFTPKNTMPFFSITAGVLDGKAIADIAKRTTVFNNNEYIKDSCGKNITLEYNAAIAADSIIRKIVIDFRRKIAVV